VFAFDDQGYVAGTRQRGKVGPRVQSLASTENLVVLFDEQERGPREIGQPDADADRATTMAAPPPLLLRASAPRTCHCRPICDATAIEARRRKCEYGDADRRGEQRIVITADTARPRASLYEQVAELAL